MALNHIIAFTKTFEHPLAQWYLRMEGLAKGFNGYILKSKPIGLFDFPTIKANLLEHME